MNKTEIKKAYPQLYVEIEDILFRCDPININFKTNKDEYAPEVGTILPRLKDAQSESDVHNIIYDEFKHWFGTETAGNKANESYAKAATEIWAAWQKFNEQLRA